MSHPGLMIGEATFEPRRSLATRRRSRYHFWRRLTPRILVLLAITAGIFALGHWLLTAALFSIDRVETGRYRYTAAGPLETILSTALGQNIWTFGDTELRSALETLPWVREVDIHRLLPGSLRVELREWQPLLAVVPRGSRSPETEGDLVLLADGRVVTFPSDLHRPVLPVLAGVDLTALGTHQWCLREIDAESLLNLVAAIAATGLEAEHPVDFILPVEDGFKLVLQKERRGLLVGRQDAARQLTNFLLTRDQDDGVSDIDLRCDGKIIFKRDKNKV